MEINGIPIETVYLYALIISGVITILLLLFGDLFHVFFADIHFLNPVIILSFITFTSGSGYLLEVLTKIPSTQIMLLSSALSLILVTLLNVFVLIPLSSAEESLVYKESDLVGRIGVVITPIPIEGFGEVMIESLSGRIAKTASSYDKKEIKNGTRVLVVEVENGVLQVVIYDKLQEFI